MPGYVLLIDDSRSEAEIAKYAWQSCDIQAPLKWMKNKKEVEQAFFQAEKPAELPSFILLDIEMGADSGLDILSTLRQDARTKYIPVIMYSSADDPHTIRECLERGANSFVVKPADFNDTVALFRALWIYWNQFNTQFKPQDDRDDH